MFGYEVWYCEVFALHQ